MLVMGRTCQLKWGKPAANALRGGCVFQRASNVTSTQKRGCRDKRSSSGGGAEGKETDRAASWMPLWALSPKCCRIQNKQKKISHNVRHWGMLWKSAPIWRGLKRTDVLLWQQHHLGERFSIGCDKHKVSEPLVPSTRGRDRFLCC